MNTMDLLDLMGTAGELAAAGARHHGPDLLGAAEWTRVARLIDTRMESEVFSPVQRHHWLRALAVVSLHGQLVPVIRVGPGTQDVAEQMAKRLWIVVLKVQFRMFRDPIPLAIPSRTPFPPTLLPDDNELSGLFQAHGLMVSFWWRRWCASTDWDDPLQDVVESLWIRDLDMGSIGRFQRAQVEGHIVGGRHVAKPLTPRQWKWINGPAVQHLIAELLRDLCRR
jgi:hypothetical protein